MVPFKDVYSVMANWGANQRGPLAMGISGPKLITLASMLRIPVCMHNVAEERIFRPTAWSAFGAMDPQGADFRALRQLWRAPTASSLTRGRPDRMGAPY